MIIIQSCVTFGKYFAKWQNNKALTVTAAIQGLFLRIAGFWFSKLLYCRMVCLTHMIKALMKLPYFFSLLYTSTVYMYYLKYLPHIIVCLNYCIVGDEYVTKQYIDNDMDQKLYFTVSV